MKALFLLFSCCTITISAASLDVPRLPGKKLEKPPKIDGILSEGEWDGASTATNFIDPVTSNPASEQTQAYIGYDKQNIYVAFKCHDSQPSGIIARSIQHGGKFDGEDMVIFGIDPLNRRIEGSLSQFRVNALGTSTERISGGTTTKREWAGEWTAAAKIVEDGWVVEMMIPWKILNASAAKSTNMELNFARVQERTKTASFWADLTQRDLPEKDGIWENIEVQATQKPKIEGLIYASPDSESVAGKTHTSFRSGIDLRYKFSPVMTGVLSLNPDFRNIESEIAGIEFTRSERFISEARPFFNEGSSFFHLTDEFTIGQMFYSRRIDDFDEGVKVFGNINKTDAIGVLATREDGKRTDAVMRYRHQIGPRTGYSMYTTHRSGEGKTNNLLGGTAYWGQGNYAVDIVSATSNDNGKSTSAGDLGAFYSVPGLFTMVRASYIQPGFRPALAFIPFDDQRGAYWFTEYNREFRKGSIVRHHAEMLASSYQTFNNKNQDKSFSLGTNVLTRKDMQFRVGVDLDRFGTEESRSVNGRVTFNASNSQRQFGLSVTKGERANHTSDFYAAFGQYRVGKGLDLGLSHAVRKDPKTFAQSILTVGWEMDRFRSLTARAVKNDKDVNAYLAFRRAGSHGLEYYLILGDPNAQKTAKRIAFKVVWAF